MSHVQKIVVENVHPAHGHFTGCDACDNVFSTKVIEALGADRLTAFGRLLPIVSVTGETIGRHMAFLSTLPDRSTFRGDRPIKPSVCGECGRLLYWPGSPPTTWYLLRDYWPEAADMMPIGRLLVLSERTWDERIVPLKLPRVVGHKIPLVDRPRDGFPAPFDELLSSLKKLEKRET